MATTKSIPTSSVLPPAGDALPDIDVIVQDVIAQCDTLEEVVIKLESALAPYANLPQDSTHRLVHSLMGLTRALTESPHGLH